MVGSLWRTLVGVLAIAVATATAVGAALALLPPLELPFGLDGWFVRLVLTEWSLLLVGPAVLALLLAGGARWAGTPRIAFWSALLAVLALLAAFVHPVRGLVSASDHGIRPGLVDYFAGTAYGGAGEPDDTVPYANVWRPDGPGPWPAVLVIPDGADVRPAWSSWLTDAGFVVFELTDPPGTAVSRVRADAGRYGVDPDRLTLFGFGTGGDLAIRTAAQSKAEAGVESVIAMYPTTHGVRPPDELPRSLLIQGGSDLIVEPRLVRELAADLDTAGNQVEYVDIGYADHGFDVNWGGFGNQVARARIERFLRPR